MSDQSPLHSSKKKAHKINKVTSVDVNETPTVKDTDMSDAKTNIPDEGSDKILSEWLGNATCGEQGTDIRGVITKVDGPYLTSVNPLTGSSYTSHYRDTRMVSLPRHVVTPELAQPDDVVIHDNNIVAYSTVGEHDKCYITHALWIYNRLKHIREKTRSCESSDENIPTSLDGAAGLIVWSTAHNIAGILTGVNSECDCRIISADNSVRSIHGDHIDKLRVFDEPFMQADTVQVNDFVVHGNHLYTVEKLPCETLNKYVLNDETDVKHLAPVTAKLMVTRTLKHVNRYRRVHINHVNVSELSLKQKEIELMLYDRVINIACSLPAAEPTQYVPISELHRELHGGEKLYLISGHDVDPTTLGISNRYTAVGEVKVVDGNKSIKLYSGKYDPSYDLCVAKDYKPATAR